VLAVSRILLRSRLYLDRRIEGRFWVEDADDGRVLLAEQRCRGEADNATAARHDNVIEDPTRVGGDHPAGTYRVARAVSFHESDRQHWTTYGPWFFALEPVAGEALVAAEYGRSGIGLHGGAPGPGGTLRETFGCLRVFNTTAFEVARLIVPLSAHEAVRYQCDLIPVGGTVLT
jgi:hypothetical protein